MIENLRPYQVEAADAIFREWESASSTLLILPTGAGKTQVFCEVIRRKQPLRALVLAHRAELIWQAVKRLKQFGIESTVEMADCKASTTFWNRSPVVVSTVQTQYSGKNGGRMTRFDPMDFNLLVLDEAHHYTATTYRKVIDYYRRNPDLKILGVTATPDRADEQALGQIFQTVAYDYEILDAIHDGWLVPIEQQMVTVAGLDYSHVHTTAGDLNGAELAAIMEAEEILQGIAGASLDIIADRRTLVFATSVKHAEMLAEIYCRHRDGMAEWVCGKTEKQKRQDILKRFASGQTQVVVNVGVLTEGFDNPAVEVIIQGRPTKSRCLYSQMVGRATRPLPGIVDGLDTPEQRREAIANSAKPACLVVDFVGNAGRHKLMTTADILGGKVSEEVIERAAKRAAKDGQPFRMDELLDEEVIRIQQEIEIRKRNEALRKAKLVAKVQYQSRQINPFDTFDMTPAVDRGWDDGRRLSEKQRDLLMRQGIDPDSMSYAAGRQLLNTLFARWKAKLATLKQCALVKKHYPEYDVKTLSMTKASELIDGLAKNGWKRPQVPA